ncbi:MAG TPA: TonB family protein [Blastocatellia bacterium]|nr:TonB family protein [Blastocatellia bacterium]
MGLTKKRSLALYVLAVVVGAQAAIIPAQVQERPAPAPARLLADLKSADAVVRRAALNQLGAIRARDAVRVIIGALSDKDAGVREAAAFALGQITDPSAATALVRAVEDPDAEVRASAAFALGMLGDRSHTGTLSRLLEDKETAVRSSAIAGLGLLQDEEGVDEIIEMLSDPTYDARYDAVWALGQIGEPDADGHLRTAAQLMSASRVSESARESFRQAVQFSLENLRTPENAAAALGRPRRATVPRESRISRPASIRQTVKPAITERALRARVTGTVSVRVLVEASGRAVRAYVTRRLGYGLDQRAIEAVLQYRFDPAIEAGLPQTSWIDLDVKF